MATTIERVIFSFSEYDKEIVTFPRAIACAPDNRFLVCSKESIQVFTISTDLNPHCNHMFKDLPFHVSVQRITDLAKLPTFIISDGLLDMAKMWSQFSHRERQEIMTDTSLWIHPPFLTNDVGAFRRAVFSPCSHLCCHSLFIATVTSDHRIFVFKECSNEWILVTELTERISKHVASSLELPLAIGQDGLSFMQFKEIIYSICCVDLVWSSAFQDNMEPYNPKSDTHLLFCGMRNGDLQIWQMKIGPGSNSHACSFTFVSKHQYSSEVTSMCWNLVEPKKGHLAVGYMNGDIRIFKVTLTVNTGKEFDAEEIFVHSPCDHLFVYDLAFTATDTSSSVLVACKQFSIGIYSIHNMDNAIKHVRNIHLDCSLPIISISLNGRNGIMASQDGTMFHLNFGIKDEQVTVDHTRSKVTCLSNLSQVPWSCKGLALSVNGAFCLSVHSPLTDFPVRFSTRITTAERQKVVLSLPPGFPNDCYVFPTTPSSVMRHYKPSADISLRLLLILKDALAKNQSLDLIEQILIKLAKSDRIEDLQVVRTICIFKVLKIHRSPLQYQELSFPNETRINELTEKILNLHASNCLSWAVRNNKDLDKLTFMLRWAASNEDRRQAILDETNLDELSGVQSEPMKFHCFLCDAELENFQNHLDIECVNGHQNQLCCLIYNPVEGIDSRHCLSCQTVASSSEEIQKLDLPCVRTIRNICVLCGGNLSR